MIPAFLSLSAAAIAPRTLAIRFPFQCTHAAFILYLRMFLLPFSTNISYYPLARFFFPSRYCAIMLFLLNTKQFLIGNNAIKNYHLN